MQISMELMSLFVGQADSGMGVRQRAGPGSRESFQFEKVFGEAMAEAGQQATYKRVPAEKAEYAEKTDIPAQPQKSEDEPDENLAAGMMGNQENVVFILEGDRESATTPEANVDAATVIVEADTGVIIGAYQVETEKDFNVDRVETEVKPDMPVASETEAVAVGDALENQTSAGELQNIAVQPKADVTVKAAIDTAAVENDAGDAAGEVTARMPIIRTSERQENEHNNAEFSKNGDLSPLENENDHAPVKGQKEKTYSETADAARNKAENAQEPVNNAALPLAQGLKPEQFKADQEMKQVAPDTPVRAENLFDEMVSRIETMQTESTQSMTIQLKPEFLGKVALEIAMDAAGLHVKIDAANSEVRAMLGGQINSLIESLENKGIEVVEVEVAYTGIDNGAFKENREDQGQSDKPRRSLREIDPVDGAAYYAALPVDILDYYLEDLDAGISSVEYRA